MTQSPKPFIHTQTHTTPASYLQGFYKAPPPDSTEASTYRRLKTRQVARHTDGFIEVFQDNTQSGGGAYLRVDQRVVEKDEPVDGEPAGVLQSQGLVAALADQPALGLPQRVLAKHSDTGQLTPTRHLEDSTRGPRELTVILPGKLFQKWKV